MDTTAVLYSRKVTEVSEYGDGLTGADDFLDDIQHEFEDEFDEEFYDDFDDEEDEDF